MELLAKKRKALRAQVTRLVNESQEALTRSTAEDVRVFEHRLKALQLQLNATDDKIEQERADQLDETEFEQVFLYSDKLVTCLAKLTHRREALEASERAARDLPDRNPSNGTAPSTNRTKVRLPKLELMRFNGERTSWQQFWEQFDLVVHGNEDLTEVDKFNYLKGCLTGDAAAAVKGLPPTSKCYNDAIDLLKRRFGDEELLVQSHMRKLIDLDPVCSSDDVKGLRSLYDNVVTHVRGLETLGRKQETFSSLLLPILQRALPKDLLLIFNKRSISERRNGIAEVPETGQQEVGDSGLQGRSTKMDSFAQLLDFLEVELQSREDVEFIQHISGKTKKRDEAHSGKGRGKRKDYRNPSSAAALHQSTQVDNCFFCKAENHSTPECDTKIELEEKKNRLRSERRCFRCTRPNHQARTCRNHVKCKNCGGRHATVMCNPDFVQKKASMTDAVTTVPVNLQCNSDERRPAVLLPTMTVWCQGESQREQVRALLDSGSQRSFVCTEISRKMKCKKVGTETLTVGVFGGHQTEKDFTRVLVRFEVQDGRSQEIEALEIETICNQSIPSPSSSVAEKLSQLQCKLGDTSAQGGPINIGLLFGCEHYWTITTGRSRKLNDQLRAIETVFGWAVQGPALGEDDDDRCSQAIALKSTVCSRDTDILTKFWALEAIGIDDRESQEAIDPVVNYFEETVNKTNDRYEVALPWRDHVNLNSNKEVAKRRLQQLTSKLQKVPVWLEAYDVAIRQYYGDDMAELVDEDVQTEHFTYYMPHQAVIRESRTTTKLRVVFDASSHAPGSLSLNDNLQSGPNLTADLVALLLNFRRHSVALVADMEKAFLQIQVKESDRDALRFLWYDRIPRSQENTPNIVTFRMKRVPFGTTSSPFLLAATLKHHFVNMAYKFPTSSKLLSESMYVDDLLTGAENEEAALKLYRDANDMMTEASMKFHKWASNNKLLRERFETDVGDTKNLGYVAGVLKVLGLVWNPFEDTLGYTVDNVPDYDEGKQHTKRTMLKTTASVYDPLGWVQPFVVRAKHLFQKLWVMEVDWDDVLPEEIDIEWKKWCSEVNKLRNIQVPRRYTESDRSQSCFFTLHIFADASPIAYGTVAYLSVTDEHGDTTSTLLISKSRIAPVKTLTLARLELMACVLSARLYFYLQRHLKVHLEEVFFWSDSTIAIHWINCDPSRWKTFVRNRVEDIQRHTDAAQWRHCSGKENPADLVTRGVSATNLVCSTLWWNGPEWIRQSKENWPRGETGSEQCQCREEEAVKRTDVLQTQVTETTDNVLLDMESYSSLHRLLRITAWVLRYVRNSMQENRTSGPINVTELDEAEKYWTKRVQGHCFATEIKCTLEKRKLPPNSPLRTLNMFIDEEGLLRVKGRLQFSGKGYDEKHPIVLPKTHHLSMLIVRGCHRQVLHSGVRDTLVQVRERHWIVGARQLIKKIIKQCITCQRFHSRRAEEVAPPLPKERVTEALPFEVTGIDFGGPLLVRGKRNVHKSYITLFTCGVTRAIHLEYVEDMSADTFLRAFRRFVSRRGVPRIIYTDNALTFKRSKKHLEELWNAIRNPAVQDHFASQKVQWKFIVERAPWWGGFYERLMGSTKLALKKTIGTKFLSADELTTYLCEIEAVLNSRPLTHLYDEPQEPTPLCPAYFLAGKRLTTLPYLTGPEVTNIAHNQLRQSWTDRQMVMTSFWKRWSKDYLAELKTGLSRRGRTATIEEGKLVLLQETMLPRQQWKMARVEECFVGRDGKVRSCKLKLPSGITLKRPIQLLFPLELGE